LRRSQWRLVAEKTNQRKRFLCARRERPSCCRSPEKRDELTSLHVPPRVHLGAARFQARAAAIVIGCSGPGVRQHLRIAHFDHRPEGNPKMRMVASWAPHSRRQPRNRGLKMRRGQARRAMRPPHLAIPDRRRVERRVTASCENSRASLLRSRWLNALMWGILVRRNRRPQKWKCANGHTPTLKGRDLSATSIVNVYRPCKREQCRPSSSGS
jgi:hypothetical protein